MINPNRPMLAANATDKIPQLKYPLYGSPKHDGVRCLVRNGVLFSRSGKRLPNKELQKILGVLPELDHVDGEIILSGCKPSDVFRLSSSKVMSADSDIHGLQLHIFDYISTKPYNIRMQEFISRYGWEKLNYWEVIQQELINNENDLHTLEAKYLAQGYEGLMLRAPEGKYKYGRSTFKEHLLLKIKRFADEEGEIISFNEQYANLNPAEKNELGYTKRSSKKEGKLPLGQLGYLEIKSIKSGKIFEIGTGFTDLERRTIWDNKNKYKNKIVKFKYFPHGTFNKPRHPVFLGFRDPRDM